MKKALCFCVFIAVLLCTARSFGAELQMLRLRNALLEESKKIQMALADSPDPVLVISLWDTCVVTLTKINAYFYMVGIFEMVEDKDKTEQGVDFLLAWLKELQRTTQVNIRELNTPVEVSEEATTVARSRLSELLARLNTHLDEEIRKVSSLRASVVSGGAGVQ